MESSTSTDLRAAFARRLSSAHGREVPECTTLVEVAAEVSREVLEREGSAVRWWAEPAAAPVRRTLAGVTQVLDPYGLLGTEALRAALTDDTAAAEGSAR